MSVVSVILAGGHRVRLKLTFGLDLVTLIKVEVVSKEIGLSSIGNGHCCCRR